MNERLEWSSSARSDLGRIDRRTRERIQQAIYRYVETEYGDVRPLRGLDEWRLRVGDWRIRFIRDTELRVIRIIRVLPRGSAYR